MKEVATPSSSSTATRHPATSGGTSGPTSPRVAGSSSRISIGMGDSDKLPVGEPDRYRFVCHSRYLDALLIALGARDRVLFVLHDWGGALGFDCANRNRSAVRGLAYTETFVRPLGWSDLPESFHPTLQAVCSPPAARPRG